MNDLEKLLRNDLHHAADDLDIPVSLVEISAGHARLARRATVTRWALAAAVFVLAVAAGLWWLTGWRPDVDRGVPNPLQTPPVPTVTATSEPTPTAPSPTATPAATPSPSASPGPGAGRLAPAFVYYVVDSGDARGLRLVREVRQVTAATPARGALEAMMAGPLDPDYESLWPAGTRILGIAHRDGVITVDLSAEARAASVGSAGEAAMVAQLVWTVTEALEPDAGVRVLIEGQPAEWGHDSWGTPRPRGEALSVRQLIGIDLPAQGATVGSPVTVSGQGAVYEANVPYRVTRADGTLVTEGFTMTAEAFVFTPYSFTLDLPPGEYVVTVSEGDPSGGEGFRPATDSRAFTVR